MTVEQIEILAVLVGTMGLFIWGRWRADFVALLALAAAVVLGLVPGEQAFLGFGHPAVITVAAVLVISSSLARAGLVDLLVARLVKLVAAGSGRFLLLDVLAALVSGFMNNIGALALLMPVGLGIARRDGVPASRVLMPLSFASILGGLVTLIGTPPNIIVSGFRQSAVGEGYAMFDFLFVGAPIALVGIGFLAVAAQRLLPKRRDSDEDGPELNLADYVTEFVVPEDSPLIGQKVDAIGPVSGEASRPTELALIRRRQRIVRRLHHEALIAGDILAMRGTPEQIETAVAQGLELLPQSKAKEAAEKDAEETSEQSPEKPPEDAPVLVEVVVPPRAMIEGRSASELRLRARYGVNLLAISREGSPIRSRLQDAKIRAGDVLLIQAEGDTIYGTVSTLGCLPLVQREITLDNNRSLMPLGIFALAIAATAAGLASAAVCFALAVLAIVLIGSLTMTQVYEAIDWPVIVLLAAMIPVGGALDSTGAARAIAGLLAEVAGTVSPYLVLGLVLVLTMTLSDIMNNAATAVVMAPIAIGVSDSLGLAPDPLLMAVAVGASCAFLTPIGHQNNLLVMGPGGYHFGDYWRLGLPLEILIILVAVPLIPFVWPF
ncbi:MAG: SLC13 family permease [Proteobacteria bacterium]|nr:SLC13 family permease [Pseudomonadota bacterium]MDA1308817.1 SLC13 family permease [Pseudomonadota bacterium]